MIVASVSALAQTSGTAAAGKGSITIKNASNGDTYKVFKLFDATLTDAPATGDSAGIAYTGDIPSGLAQYFTKDNAGNIHIAKHEKDGEQVEWSAAEITAAVQEWAEDLEETDPHYVTKATSDGTPLTFQGLEYGYYAVTSSLGSVISIDSNRPNAEIIDKNSGSPTAHKQVNKKENSVGDTVTYTAFFDAPNSLKNKANPTTGEPEQVVSYIIKDTLPDFLTNVQITSVQIGKWTVTTTDDVQTYEQIGTLQDDLSSNYTAFTNKQIEIPWVNETVPTADHKYTNKYTSGTQIKITYTAVLTANTQLVADNTNTVSLFPQVDRGTGKEPYQEQDQWHDDAVVTTYGAAIQKKDDADNNLPGAEFRIKGLTVTGANGLYTVVEYNPEAADGTGTVMQCDANGLLRIGGLENALTLTVTETKAPDGYNKLANPFTLTTTQLSSTTTSSSGSVTRYYDADGNLVDEESQSASSTTTTEYTSLENIPAESIQKVINNKGTELPSTGGIGTTLFYIGGGILVLAAVLLITKRRMSADE